MGLALALLPLQSAKACSCALGDPRDAFAASEGAFVGTFVESHLAEPPDPDGPLNSGADTIYSFALDEEYKGELGEPGDIVEVHSAFSGASCGLQVEEGRQYGLFLSIRKRDGVWSSSLCRQVPPDVMREAASPLPAPTGEGPVAMLLGGSFGEAQVMALDGRGRTLGYGFGGKDVYHVDVCPGSKRAVEIGQSYPDPPILFVRDVATMEVVRRLELPYGRGQRYPGQSPAGLDCRTRLARRIVVFSTFQAEPESRSLLLRVRGDRASVIHRGSGTSAAFGRRAAYMPSGPWGRQLVKVSLRSGTERPVTRLPGRHQTALTLSPDGRRLSGIAIPPWDEMDTEPTTFYTVRLDRRPFKLRIRSLGRGEVYAHTGWMSPRRPVAFVEHPGPSRVFDLRLRVVSRFGKWPARAPVVLGRRAFGPGYEGAYGGALYRVRLPDGAVGRARGLPSPIAYPIVAVP